MTGEPLREAVKGIPVRNTKIAFDNNVWHVTVDGIFLFKADGNLTRARGRTYKNKYMMVFQVRDQKILSWKEYFNPVVAARTFGIPLESLP